MIFRHSRFGFTMIELIFAIVILGIVSSIGASLIARVYESYITQRALHLASTKADLAAKQITARLTYRISASVIAKQLGVGGGYYTIDQADPTGNYNILEWIGYDNDSFSATAKPGWSGFCDINASTKTAIKTPGSDLNSTQIIIGNLGGSVTDAAIIFNGIDYSSLQNYHAVTMGFGTADYAGTPLANTNSTISPVSSFDTAHSTINVTDNNSKIIRDQYKLVWTAYALVPAQQTDNPNTAIDESKLFDLELYYNYQPWAAGGETYAVDAANSTLVKDVTAFKFKGMGDTIRFKICVQEKISSNSAVNACKEKAVIR